MSICVSTRHSANSIFSARARSFSLALLACVLLGWASPASADRFDAAAKGAIKLAGEDTLSALFWSQDVNCAKAKGDFRKRQCRGVRDARRAKIAKRTYLVDVSGPAIDLSVKPETMSALVTLRACVACESEGVIVVGKGVHKVSGGKLLATSLATKTKVFKKLSHLEHWAKYIVGRYRAQFLVKISAPTERFKMAGRSGYKVSVVGYRFYDPCKGNVIAAKPSSKKGPVRSGACDAASAAATDEPKIAKQPKIVHPDRLSTVQIKTAMKDVTVMAKKCHEAYGIDGTATFKIVIAGSGKLTRAKQSGDFEGTPTGICLDKAMKMAVFPQSKKKSTPVTYPMILR